MSKKSSKKVNMKKNFKAAFKKDVDAAIKKEVICLWKTKEQNKDLDTIDDLSSMNHMTSSNSVVMNQTIETIATDMNTPIRKNRGKINKINL